MEVNTKELDRLYKEWSGKSQLENSNRFFHDSAECTDFARFILEEHADRLLKSNTSKESGDAANFDPSKDRNLRSVIFRKFNNSWDELEQNLDWISKETGLSQEDILNFIKAKSVEVWGEKALLLCKVLKINTDEISPGYFEEWK